MTTSLKALPFSLPPPEGGCVDVLIVAGEHSGDEHAARMVQGLLAQQPALRVCALGGPKLAAAGPSAETVTVRWSVPNPDFETVIV